MHSSPYRLVVTRAARKEITNLQPRVRRQVWEAIKRLLGTVSDERRPQDMRPLKGVPDGYRIDTGEYRVLFHLNTKERVVTVVRAQHRKDVYRNL